MDTPATVTTPAVTPTQGASLLTAAEAFAVTALKIVGTVGADISDPANLFNFSADLALFTEFLTAYSQVKTVIADIKAAV